MFHKVIWPERRYVDDSVIRRWYADAVANREVEETGLNDPREMAKELHGAGVITLGGKR